MLRELHIKNLAIIDDVTVEFGPGLNVLTGETGAGKSVIIDALGLALGERSRSVGIIRSGEKEAVVEAFFDVLPGQLNESAGLLLKDMGIDAEDGLILKRIISVQGKSRAYINSSMVNIQTLADVSGGIIDVHGQYEHQSLLKPDNQLELLDAYAGLLPERQKVSALHGSLLNLKQQISDLAEKDRERARRLDMLDFQINEINAAGLRPGEEEELENEVKVLGSSGRLAELANQAYESLYSSDTACMAGLSGVLDALKEISGIDARAGEPVRSVQDALPLLEEAAYFLRDYKDGLDFDPARLEAVQERLELIRTLKRKYGRSIQEILEHRDRAEQEVEDVHLSGEKLAALKTELEQVRKDLTNKAKQLSRKRKAVSKKVKKLVVEELARLSMADTDFSIRISNDRGDDTTDGFKVNSKGIDRIEFLISPNVGEELRPLTKIASGGELSRVMLALKGIMAKGDRIPVLVFDEIDAGIGGKAAETVGKKLKDLSTGHQEICITHLPQIASYADSHLKIEKKVKGKRTVVDVRRIDQDERAEEIARMLSGDSSDVSIKHAEQMLRKTVNR